VISPTPRDTGGAQSARAGMLLPRDILFAPTRAFRLIAETREWLPAFLIVVALGFAAVALIAPALSHVTLELAKRDPSVSPRDYDAIARGQLIALTVQQTLFEPVAWSITALVLTTFARLRGMTASFSTVFSLAANAWIPAALGSVFQGLAVRLHDPSSYHTIAQLALALPLNLAVLAPHGTDREIAFLSTFDVFTAWSLVLTGYGFAALAGVRLVTALTLSFTIALGLALIFELG
jgi:hypothetical protein